MLLICIYSSPAALACFVLLSWSPLLNDQVLGHARPPHIRRPSPQPPPHCALMQKYPESSYADCIAGVAPTNANAKHITESVCKYISLEA